MNVSLVRWVGGLREVKSFAVHRLVADLWVNGKQDGWEVNHKDFDKSHNDYRNLEWVTSSDNKLHATAHGLYPVGEDHYRWSGGAPGNAPREARRELIRNQYKRKANGI